jgi:branched-chain amino acid transport system ATP-binding protein
MSDLLALDTVSVAYGKRRALESVSLTIGPGEIVTLLGANGSGKSTTLRTISGLVRSQTGRIVFDGRDITRAAPDAIVAAGVSHVPEGREIFPQFTVHENLLVGGHTVPRAGIAEATERAFALFPILRERARQPAGTLSGGEQQMLAIARALMIRPRLLLLDEPSLGLAPRLTREIFGVIGRINAEGVTVLLVEQNARRALALASRAYVLETGRVVVSGPARALAADPRIRAAYLGLAELPPPALGAVLPDKER